MVIMVASSFDDQQMVSASNFCHFQNSLNISNSYFCTQCCAFLFPFANLTNRKFKLIMCNDVTDCNSFARQ